MRPECRSLTVIFTLDPVSPPGFTFLSFLTTLVATRRCRCLLRSAWVNIMPVRLLFVISGILAGGIPGFRIGPLLLLSPDVAHSCVFAWFCFVFFIWAILWMTHKMSFCIEFPLLVAILFLSFLLVFVLAVCFCLRFPFWFVFCLIGLPTGLCIGPLPALLRLLTQLTALQANYNSACLLRLNVCNDLAKAMKALDGKKKSAGPSTHRAHQPVELRLQCRLVFWTPVVVQEEVQEEFL